MVQPTSTSKSRYNAQAYHDNKYEPRMQQALEAYHEGKFPSMAAAARAFKVKPRTLSGRNSGKHKGFKEAAERRRLLPPAMEDVLVEWLGDKAEQGLPMDYREIRSHASALKGQKVGKKWVPRFLLRHPEIITAKPSKLDPKRAQNFNKNTISEFFDQYESLFKDFGEIPPEHIWNMDEKGIQLGGGRKDTNRRYIYLRNMHNRYRISSDNLELVTVVECINAAGDSLPPAFILAEGPQPDLTDCPDGSIGSVSTSPAGWTDDNLTLEWVKNVFIPYTLEKRVDNSKPIVLLCDGHGSHETLELREAIYNVEETPIIILCFPSKCTHKLQPLDVVVFAQSQRQWREHCDTRTHEGVTMNRYNVIQEYMEVRGKHIFPSLLKKSFRKTGLYPVNRDIFTDEDFAPSKATSVAVSVPDSFTDDIPSSDPAVPTDAEDADYSDSEDDCSSTAGTECGRGDREDDLSDSVGNDEDIDDEREDDSEREDDEPDMEEGQAAAGALDAPMVSDERAPAASRSPQAQSRYKTRFSAPSGFLNPPDLIAQCERDLATMQKTRDTEKDVDDLLEEVHGLRKLLNHTLDALQAQYALSLASDAHNTIIKRELETARVQLDNSRKQRKNGSVKTKSRLLTLPQSKALFLAERAERMEKDRLAAEKDAQKSAEKAERDRQVRRDAQSKAFDSPLHSYTLKDDLRTIAQALGLESDGTVSDLRESIRAHMDENKAELIANPRFSALFTNRRRGRAGVSEAPPQPDAEPAIASSSTLPVAPNPPPIHASPHLPSPMIHPPIPSTSQYMPSAYAPPHFWGQVPAAHPHFEHPAAPGMYPPNQHFAPYPHAFYPHGVPNGYPFSR